MKLLSLLLKKITKSIYDRVLNVCVYELQGKMKDAMDWLTLQEQKLQKMLKDSENETYCEKYEVSMALKNN